MAPFRWLKAALSRRGREAQSVVAPSLAKSKRRKLPGFKGFGRSASTTQLVSLGGLSSSNTDDDTTVADASIGDGDWRIEPVPPVAAAVAAEAGTTSEPAGKTKPHSLAVAKGWYLATHCALALFPFPAIYLSDRGLSSVEIGTIMALRPFISAVAGNAWAILADATRSHRTVLLSTFVAAGVARGLVGLPILKTFWPLLAAVLLSEAVAAPVIILADAATQQAAEAAGSDYGRVRLFGAVGLGAFSPLNGLIVTRLGNGAGFVAGAAAWLAASCLTAALPVAGLSAAAARGQRPAGRRAASEAGGGSSCCGGRLPLPLPAPFVVVEETSEAEEEEEEAEEEEEEEAFAAAGGGEMEESTGRAATAGEATTATTAAQRREPAPPPLSLPSSRFGGAATTTRARLSSHGGGGGGESGKNSGDGGTVAAVAAVAAAAAALSPPSPPPPPPRAGGAPARPGSLAAASEEAFERGRSESGDGGELRGAGESFRGSPSPAPSSSTAASSMSTRPLSPAALGGAAGNSKGRTTISSSSAAALALSSRRRTSSSSAHAFIVEDASALPLHRKLAAVFGSPRAALFFATAWTLGYGAGTIDSWLFVFLEEEPLRASKQLMGVTILVTCATEVPAFFFAGRLIERIGAQKMLSVVSVVLAARLAGYWSLPSLSHNPWIVLTLETLNGVTFGCGWAAGTARAASLAPPGLAATAQAAFAAVYGGLGAGLGSLAGGVVRSRAGSARCVFAAAAAVVALSWAATAAAEALAAAAAATTSTPAAAAATATARTIRCRPPPLPPAATDAASKLWYLWTYAAQAMLVPFLNLAFLRQAGLTRAQLGVVSAARPWLSAITGNLWALWADATGSHGPVLAFSYCAAGLLRYSLRYARGFSQTLGAVLLMEALGSPVNIIADAAVIASGAGDEGSYGRTRLFGAVGWGLFSPLGGWLVQERGLGAAFVANGVGWGSGLLLTLLLPVQVLSSSSSSTSKKKDKRKAKEEEEGASACSEPPSSSSSEAAAAAALSSSSPPPPPPSASAAAAEAAAAASPPPENGSRGGGIAGSRRRRTSSGVRDGGEEEEERGEEEEEEGEPSSPSDDDDGDETEAAAAVAEAAAREAPLASAAELVAFDGHALAHHHSHLHHKKKRKGGKRGGRSRSHPADGDVEEPLLLSSSEGNGLAAAAEVGTAEVETAGALSTTSFSSSDDDNGTANESLPLREKLSAIFSDPKAAPFFATAMLFGYAMGTIDCWLFVFLDEALGAGEALMGATLTVTCLVEAPVFWASGPLIRALGVPRILAAVHAAFLLRLSCYWLLPYLVDQRGFSPWVVLAVEPLHGITFGCAWAAGCAQAARLAPRGLEATTQALFSGLYLGAGSGLGALIGGAVHARFSREGEAGSGGRAVFAVAAGVVAVGWLLSALAGAFAGRQQQRRQQRRQQQRG